VSNLSAISWNEVSPAYEILPALVFSSRTINNDKTYYSDVVIQVSDAIFFQIASNRMVEMPISKSYSYGGATHIEFFLESTAPSWAIFDSNKNTVVVNTSAISEKTEYSFELKSKIGLSSCEYTQIITIRVEH
jgi:hypothetical protein